MYNLIIPCSLSHIIVPKYCDVGASLQVTSEKTDLGKIILVFVLQIFGTIYLDMWWRQQVSLV